MSDVTVLIAFPASLLGKALWISMSVLASLPVLVLDMIALAPTYRSLHVFKQRRLSQAQEGGWEKGRWRTLLLWTGWNSDGLWYNSGGSRIRVRIPVCVRTNIVLVRAPLE